MENTKILTGMIWIIFSVTNLSAARILYVLLKKNTEERVLIELIAYTVGIDVLIFIVLAYANKF